MGTDRRDDDDAWEKEGEAAAEEAIAGTKPAKADDTVAPAPVDPRDPRRQAIVGDPENIAYVRGILRGRGVPEQEIDDKLGDTVRVALESPRLPLDDPKAGRSFLGGIARFMGTKEKVARAKALRRTQPLDDHEETTAARGEVPHETRQIAWMVRKLGHAMFGKDWAMYERNKVEGETSEEIARSLNVTAGYVRTRIGRMGMAVQTSLVAAGVVLLVTLSTTMASVWSEMHGGVVTAPNREPDESPEHPHAEALRQRGAAACEEGRYQACADDLEAAYAMDPHGESYDVLRLRESVARRLKDSPPAPSTSAAPSATSTPSSPTSAPSARPH